MALPKALERATGIPDGYCSIPIHKVDNEAPLRLCVVLRLNPDPLAGLFVLLKDLSDASVYLGCLTDAAGRVWDWLELWVQNLDNLAASLPSQRENLTNHLL